jgi:hypothetical protein
MAGKDPITEMALGCLANGWDSESLREQAVGTDPVTTGLVADRMAEIEAAS